MTLSTPTKAAATGLIATTAIVAVPPLFKECPAFSDINSEAGPPGYACFGGTFVTLWLTVPLGFALVAGASAAVAAIWRR